MIVESLLDTSWEKELIGKWLQLWDVENPQEVITVQFSQRMTRSLGRCYPGRKLIRLSERLLHGSENLLKEALCHELAHIAVYELFGNACLPHGPEWQKLMRDAGFEPRTRLHWDG